jgi:hypothetical protein
MKGRRNMNYSLEKPDKFFELIESIDPLIMSIVPKDESWCLDDIIVHIVDTEIQSYVGLISILAENNPNIPNYDEKQWASLGRKIDISTAKNVVRFIRSEILRVSSKFTDSDLQHRFGIHSERGPESFITLSEIYEKHIDSHIKQAKRIIRKLE